MTPVLPQWNQGIVLEALSKPTYELLREASLKHLILKTVLPLAMASAGRRSELQALVFDPQYIQFKPKGLVLHYISALSSCGKIRDLTKSMTRGKPDFGAPNCPVRALRYYHRYITEHAELRKGRRCLFILLKDNNAGKELSAASISR